MQTCFVRILFIKYAKRAIRPQIPSPWTNLYELEINPRAFAPIRSRTHSIKTNFTSCVQLLKYMKRMKNRQKSDQKHFLFVCLFVCVAYHHGKVLKRIEYSMSLNSSFYNLNAQKLGFKSTVKSICCMTNFKNFIIFLKLETRSAFRAHILEWIVFQPIKMINLKFYNKFSSNVNSTDWFTLVNFNNILSLQTRAFFYIECIWMWRRIRILRLKWHIKQMGFCCCCCMNK